MTSRARGLAALLALCALFLPPAARADEVRAYLFWHESCPFCERARDALGVMSATEPDLDLVEIEVGASETNDRAFALAVETLEIESPAVPMFIVGDTAVLGFANSANTAERYRSLIATCRERGCEDVLAHQTRSSDAVRTDRAEESALPETIGLPVFGQFNARDASLPVLTVVLAAIDGFNPCAMWVLAILIGFLLCVEDRRRIWTLGLVFLLTTAVMYLAIMAAWLNVVLWLGALAWLRLLVGGVAVAAGIHYLREYWTNPEGVCRVTPAEQRKTITARFRAIVDEPSLFLAALGIAALALAVNLIELVCSAGVPVVFTQVLAMRDLPAMAHYGYLLLYISVFLLDDTAIFVVAMVTMRSVASAGRYARLSHLIGGVVLICLGAILMLRPELLA